MVGTLNRPAFFYKETAMPKRMQGRIAIITGGGTGIGAACAQRLSESGAAVTIMGRRLEPLKQTAEGLNCQMIAGDTAIEADCRRAVSETLDAYGGLDTLICSAGIMMEGNVTDMTLSDWHQIINTNLNGVMQIARACIPAMRNRPGASIVVVASLGALVAPGNMAGYIASKTALLGLVRSMAVDFGPHIRVNALCPGWVLTPMSEKEMTGYAAAKDITFDDAIAHATRFLPLRRMAKPDEIAACAEFLASEDAAFITGTTLIADGGSSAVDVGYVSL